MGTFSWEGIVKWFGEHLSLTYSLVLFLFGSFVLFEGNATLHALNLPDMPPPYRMTSAAVGLFSGIMLAVLVVKRLGERVAEPLRSWHSSRRMNTKMLNLEDDELLILRDYVENGAARQHITDAASSALRSLIAKGILVPAGDVTGYWLDRITFDLTSEANTSIRRQSDPQTPRSENQEFRGK